MLHNIGLITFTRAQTSVPPTCQIRSCNSDTYGMHAQCWPVMHLPSGPEACFYGQLTCKLSTANVQTSSRGEVASSIRLHHLLLDLAQPA